MMNTPAETTQIPTKEMGSITIGEKSHESNIQIESFAIQDPDAAMMASDSASGNKAIVGTVTFFNTSAMVWIGWGWACTSSSESSSSASAYCNTLDSSSSASSTKITNSGIPNMGPMVVSMPRSKYAGSMGDEAPPCSQLISSPNDEEMMLGWQMACRLTKKVGWPVFVSTSLNKNNDATSAYLDQRMEGGMMGMEGFVDSSSISYCAALAEKKVGEIILKRKQQVE